MAARHLAMSLRQGGTVVECDFVSALHAVPSAREAPPLHLALVDLGTDLQPDAEAGARVGSLHCGRFGGEAIIGAHIFRDMFSSVRDVVGGRAGGYERALSGAREAALEDLVAAAKEMGATGIVGIDFDYAVLGETNGMMMVAVSGTAVTMG